MPALDLDNVMVKVTRRENDDGIRTKPVTVTVKLSDKVHEYLAKMGHGNAHIYNVIVHLMTEGKIRVDFRMYTERITLSNQDEIYAKRDAIKLLDQFIEEKIRPARDGVTGTQRIVIQQPKIGGH